MKFWHYIIIGSFWFSITSCSKNSLGKADYISYIEDPANKASVVREKNDVQYKLIYCPSDYIIAQEFKVDEVKEASFRKRENDLKDLDYFKLRIKIKNSNKEVVLHNTSNEQEAKEAYEYLSYGFDQNIYTVRNAQADTIPVALYHFERTYGVVPYVDVLFAFKKDTTNKDEMLKIFINDVVFTNSTLSFEFEKEQLNRLKRLKLY